MIMLAVVDAKRFKIESRIKKVLNKYQYQSYLLEMFKKASIQEIYIRKLYNPFKKHKLKKYIYEKYKNYLIGVPLIPCFLFITFYFILLL